MPRKDAFKVGFLASGGSICPNHWRRGGCSLVVCPQNLSTIFVPKKGWTCCNLNIGLTTKTRACKSAGQERSLGVTFHAPGDAKKCEQMNPHTPKGTPTLGVGVLVDFQIFIEQLQGSKLIGLRCSLYHWKTLRT